jgi:peptidoglycan/LPS O-acetylase OafA/YrhL
MERLSLYYRWKELWREEQTDKIYEFSLFRVLAIPVIMFGQIFWLTNFGAFNYYAFREEIYDKVYIRFAIFSYYLPDIFFFISAFLFTRKVAEVEDKPFHHLFKALGWKVLRLYPLYLAAVAIYWGVTPGLHAGPVWYVYQEGVQICQWAWWRVLLMIDNWFQEGCYSLLWFVQAEVQFALTVSLLFFPFYFKWGKIGLGLLICYLITTFVFLFVFSPEMLISLDVALNPLTELYYKSYHCHIWFYLMGVLMGLLSKKEQFRQAIAELL